ncbi:2418_t:CDS:2 [Paraglomus occultum]|uniref:2418_t:CDS:1 n=1 Tax=Paraglomus occultum TaxID=144539 RepID=A0A9N9F6S9_9GLOM|nr:2418_t:CDS:2 [Paraglomus occultum]
MSEKQEIKIESAEQFDAEIKKIQEIFQEKESEHTWQGFDEALSRLTIMIQNGAYKYESSFLHGLKVLRKSILNSLLTDRTRLSGTAVELIEEIAKALGPKFQPMADTYVAAILKLCMRTNKIFITRAQKCMIGIIKVSYIPAVIPKFREALQDPSKNLRACAAEFILASLEANDVGSLTDYIDDLELAIREGAIDSTPAVRATTKKTFEVYKLKFDLRLQDFVDTLPGTTKKYLGIQDKQPPKPFRPPLRKAYSYAQAKENPQPLSQTAPSTINKRGVTGGAQRVKSKESNAEEKTKVRRAFTK